MLKKHRDGGMVLPVMAVVLVTLLVMVAFAVDLGATSHARRQSQNTADAAALAAAQELGRTTARFQTGSARAAALADATAAALDYVADNTGLSATDPAWSSCTDSNALAVNSVSTPCISYSSDATQVRVRIPDRTLPYQFARVVGIDSGSVRSSAVAEVMTVIEGSTRPILLRSSRYGLNCVEGGGNQTCPSNPPPLGPGDFGSLTSPRYEVVTGGNSSDRDQVNFALGLDHMLKLTATNGTNYCDSDNQGDENRCQNQAGGILNNSPANYDLANYVFSDQGGQLKDVTVGLLGAANQTPAGCPANVNCFSVGGQTITGLLYRPDGAGSDDLVPDGSPASPLVNGFGRSGFNGVHISRYLTDEARTASGCGTAPSSDTTSVESLDFDTCNASLSAYILANVVDPPVVFDSAILDSPRFGIAPVTDTDISGASTVAKIIDFYGIYIDRLVASNQNASQVKGMRAFVFPLTMIEPTPGGGGPGLPYIGGPFGVRLIR